MVERPHGPVIVISEQETSVFAGGAKLRALEGWLSAGEHSSTCSAPLLRLARVPKSPLFFSAFPPGSRNAASSPPAYPVFGCIPNSAQEEAYE